MSNPTEKESSKGIRYTPEQKKEVIDFAVAYNSANGRGGQSKAAEKFKISQITVAAWLKSAGVSSKAPKSAKVRKAPKAPKAAKAGKSTSVVTRGTRYTPDQKQEVVDFVVAYNAANGGRGGPSNAAKKFNISPLTVTAWFKASGGKAAKKADRGSKYVPPSKVRALASAGVSNGGGFDAKLGALLALSKQIASAEAELGAMHAKFKSLKASL